MNSSTNVTITFNYFIVNNEFDMLNIDKFILDNKDENMAFDAFKKEEESDGEL